MHFLSTIVISAPIMGVLAAPQYCTSSPCFTNSVFVPQPSVTTISLTWTTTSTHTFTASPSSTYSAPSTEPTGAYGIMSARSGSPVHLLQVTATDFHLYLGGETQSYCPSEQVTNCPAGNVTAFRGSCSMDVEVPGGQQIYVSPDGSIGYTQAHSMAIPTGARLCPFTYTKSEGSSDYAGLDPNVAFGATSFMGCPTDSGRYQVFANLQNATVPQGDVSKCYGFQALASAFQNSPAAWQYA